MKTCRHLFSCLCVVFVTLLNVIICNGEDIEHSNKRLDRTKRATNVLANLTTTASDIKISDKVFFNIIIAVPAGTGSMISEIVVDNVMSICSVEVASIGSNIAGFQASDLVYTTGNGTVASYDTFNATLDFGTFENTGTSPNVTDDQIVVQFDVIVANSSDFLPGNFYDVYVLVDWNSDVAQSLLTLPAVYQDLYSIIPPIVSVSSPASVIIGDIATWIVTIDLRDALTKVQVDSWVNGTYEYPACDTRLQSKGSAFACLETASGSVISPVSQVPSASKLSYLLPTVINTAYNMNTSDANARSLWIEVIAKVPSNAQPTDSIYLNVDVFLDDKLVFAFSEQIILDASTLPTPIGTPAINLSSRKDVYTVATGSAIVFVIDVRTYPGAVTSYIVKISTTAGKASICDVQLMRIGNNVCMGNTTNISYLSTNNDRFLDQATIDAGDAPNLMPSADPGSPDNEFQLEVAICVPEHSPAAVGQTLGIGVDVYYDKNAPNKKVTETKSFTVTTSTDPLLAEGGVTVQSNNASVQGFIADTVQTNVTFRFQQTVDRFTVTISVPVVNNNARAFLEHASISWIGTNLVCMENRTLTLLSNTTVSYSQVAELVYNLGFVSQTGIAERNPFVPFSDTASIELSLLISLTIADHLDNTHGALIPITAAIEGASGSIASGEVYVEVLINGVESPELLFTFWIEQFNYADKISGDSVTCLVNLTLEENSTAHARDVVVHVMIPYYMGYLDLYDVKGAVVNQTTVGPNEGIEFSIDEIDFKDQVTFSFHLILDPAHVMPIGSENIATVLPVEMTYRGTLRGDRADTGVLFTGLIVNEFGFNTDLPQSLGMESGTIADCHITASSYLDTNPPHEARLNSGLGWKPLVRGAPFCEKEYLQINIGVPAFITGLRLQSTLSSFQDIVSTFRISYSDDGGVWYHVNDNSNNPKIFNISVSVPGSVNDVYEVSLSENEKFTAQYVRIDSLSCLQGLRLELQGLKDAGAIEQCPSVSVSPIPEQSYIINDATGNIFVCGLNNVDGNVYCSRSGDNGVSWEEIDDNIGMILAVVSNTSIAVGVSQDGSVKFVSEDDGFSWTVLTTEYFNELQSLPGYTSAVTFPYADTRGQSYATMYSMYGADGPNGVSITGTLGGLAVNDGTRKDVAWWGTEDWSTL